jgi:hypothetical protein
MSNNPNDRNYLLDAVDELTKPKRTKVLQDDGKTTTVTADPLLKQLDESIRSSLGAGSAGGRLAFEGAILNMAALFTAMKISSQIGDWCRLVDVRPVKDSSNDLRAWYVASLSRDISEGSRKVQVKQLEKWAGQIRALLDPPKEWDLPDACPLCGATEWWDSKTGTKFLRPLIVQYRATGADMIQRAKGLCRACEAVWDVRELAYSLEHAEQPVDSILEETA